MEKAQVMVVEDEGIVALSLQKELRKLGYGVPAVVSSGEEAIGMADSVRPDLILMDINLSGEIDGVDAASRIRTGLDVPVVYLTAYSDDTTIERSKAAEPYGYLVKPFDGRDLKSAIEIALYKHKMMKKLREREKWLDTTLRSIGDGVITTDLEASVNFVNRVAENLTGWPQQEATGRAVSKVFDMVDANSRLKQENPVERILREGAFVRNTDDSLLRSRDGTERPIEDSAALIKDDRENLLGAVLVFRDITERKRIEAELHRHRDHLENLVDERTRELKEARDQAEAASRAKSEFLATVSHEIRTPLTGVLGMAQLLFDTDLSQEQRSFAETLLQSGHSLLDIVNDILDFSKIERGELELKAREFDLRQLVGEAVALFSRSARDKGLNLLTDTQPDVPVRVCGDQGRVKQVLMNLVDNAIKFTAQGEVLIRLSVPDRRETMVVVHFEVVDTGIGIPAEAQDAIFDSFLQVDGSSTRGHGGTGLGLAISRRLVQLMGGEIGVESLPAMGSRFWFRVPFADALSRRQSPSPGPVPFGETQPVHKTKVLLAEDNPVNQKLTKIMLEHLGYEVEVVNNGQEALTAIKNSDYDIVLMDCQMPELDGFEATRALRRWETESGRERLRVIAVTANVFEGSKEECLKAGMDDYLGKPFNKNQLAALLASYCADRMD